MSERRPRKLLDRAVRRYSKQAVILAGDPDIALSVLRNAMYNPSGNTVQRNEPIILDVAHFLNRREPQAPAIIPKERARRVSMKLPALVTVAERDRHPSVRPQIQPSRRANPHVSIGRRKHRPGGRARQPLAHAEYRDSHVAKPIEAFIGRDPDAALTILKQRIDVIA